MKQIEEAADLVVRALIDSLKHKCVLLKSFHIYRLMKASYRIDVTLDDNNNTLVEWLRVMDRYFLSHPTALHPENNTVDDFITIDRRTAHLLVSSHNIKSIRFVTNDCQAHVCNDKDILNTDIIKNIFIK